MPVFQQPRVTSMLDEADNSAEIESVSMEETIEKAWADIQSRDDKGRFVAKESEQEGVQEVTGEHAEEAPVMEEKPARKAPSSWKKEAQERYLSLDPTLQDEIDRREADIHKGIEGYKSKAQAYEHFESSINQFPFVQQLRNSGINPIDAVTNLLQTEHTLRYGNAQQKQAALRQIMSDYQIGFEQPEQQNIPPEFQPFVQKINQLEQHLTAREQMEQQQRVRAEQERQRALNSEIQAFAEKHEHFETVKTHMAALLQTEAASSLDDAYQQAMWAHPELRNVLLAQQQKEQQAKKAADTQKAKQAAQINVKRKGTLDQSKPVGSMEDTIREEAARLGFM